MSTGLQRSLHLYPLTCLSLNIPSLNWNSIFALHFCPKNKRFLVFITDFAVRLRTKSQNKLLLNWHLKLGHVLFPLFHIKNFLNFAFSECRSSFKRSKSTSKYYNSLKIKFFFLQHSVPPTALAVSELHFLTAPDTKEISLPTDSSRQVSGYADTSLLCLAPE